jgi:hypothetical protein
LQAFPDAIPIAGAGAAYRLHRDGYLSGAHVECIGRRRSDRVALRNADNTTAIGAYSRLAPLVRGEQQPGTVIGSLEERIEASRSHPSLTSDCQRGDE